MSPSPASLRSRPSGRAKADLSVFARLTEFALSQRPLVAGLTLILVVAGLLAWQSLPIDAFPDISTTQVKIILKAPGMTPEEVEARIVAPIEMEMLGIPRQRVLRSVAKYGLTDVTIDFEEGTDVYWARQQVSERLNGVVATLPEGVSGGLAPISTPLSEMFMFTIEAPELTLEQKRRLLDWTIRPRLRTLPGVADVNALGGRVQTFEVAPDNAAMAARGVTLTELSAAVRGNNRNDGAGRLAEGEEVWLVRVEGAVRTVEDLAGIVVRKTPDALVRVGDIARVRSSSLTRYGGVTKDGRGEAVEGLVLGLKGANAQQLVQRVKERLQEIAQTLPKGVSIHPFYDRSALVERAVGTVSRALTEAGALVIVSLLLLLGNLRAALVVVSILPLSAFATFLLMQQFGLSANLMSLGGLAIAIGMLVDGAVVVVENIVAHLAEPDRAAPKLHKVYRAVCEVATPTVAGVLIILIVFLPLLTLEGLEGKLFGPVALSIVFALGAALLLSLTVVPVLASWLLAERRHREPWLLRQIERAYVPMLDFALARPVVVLSTAGLTLLVAVAVYPLVGKSFMPTLDEGDILLQLEKLPSIGLEDSLAMDLAVQKALLAKVPEVTGIVARTGADELGLDPMGLNQTDSFLMLKPPEAWRWPDKTRVIEAIRAVMAEFPGLNFTFTQPIDMRVSEMLTGSRGDLAIKLFGPDIGQLNRLSDDIKALLEATPGAEDVFALKNDGVQYVRVAIDRLAAGRHGLSVDEVADFLRAHLEGLSMGIVQEGTIRTPLVLRVDERVRMSPALFEALRIPTAGGVAIGLKEIAQLVRTEGPVTVNRENAARYVTVQCNVGGRDLVGFVDEVKARLAQQVRLPEGYRVVFSGQFENQQRAAARLAIVVPMAIALIFALLFMTFNAVTQAVLVLANVPFALVGGLVALFLAGEYLSVPASVGFIALLGIAVLNGVVLVSHFNQLAASGLPPERVIREGSLRRLRPVMMTATITALGLVPLLFATGPGSEIQKPLAIVVIGGLVSSTLLTLVVLPVLYRRFVLSAGR
ncbi:MAG: Cobalt-zinc-cadmium resistance protein CzcA [Rhodocyclaceae bacterium]|nr:Cobalt-zinc-cadmium resistance protein CzcA [Rhodocyclaceae bacterium]